MANITVKNIPQELYERLKESARVSHRSLNGEIISRLERSVGSERVTVDELLVRIDRVQGSMSRTLSTGDIRRARDEGRS